MRVNHTIKNGFVISYQLSVITPHPVGAKHSDRKSTVSPIGYCPNASPVLFAANPK
ncbi:unknown protein [Microcystis aeruginosa NIES-843]|uniref:Uncharacterized protein n=1 Tax=Microcystis aeruginosa (strain NIES-843 / IAM M-2473) TaxID=449447 RepID=B0JGE7_MICAN|nr:unknown protein [Microcystis aeruginosa NIES-843]